MKNGEKLFIANILTHTILSGYEKDISNITLDNILSEYENFKYRNKYLISNNLIVNNNSFEFLNINNVDKQFNSNQLSCKNPKRYASTHRESNQIILMIGNQTCSQSSHEYLPLKVLESHLSYGMSSVLFKLFRENYGLTYEVGVFNPFRQENSPFLIYLSVSNKNALLTFNLLIELLKNLVSNLISEQEINLAKVKLKSSFLISHQSLDEILQRRIQLIGYNLNQILILTVLTKLKILIQDILKIANRYLANPFLNIYGNEKICNKIKKIGLKTFRCEFFQLININ